MIKYYDVTTRFHYYGRLPESTRIEAGHVFGKLGDQRADIGRWREPPHERLVNLLTRETWPAGKLTTKSVAGFAPPEAVEAFIKKYGLLGDRIHADGWFDESIVDFAAKQDGLRQAWRGDASAITEIERQVADALEVRASVDAGGVELVTENLWSLICVLFLRDYCAGKAKMCASPDCPNPCFLESREGQKYCSHTCAVRENVRRFRKNHPRKGKSKQTRRSKANGSR